MSNNIFMTYKQLYFVILAIGFLPSVLFGQNMNDSIADESYRLDEVVVTGTRSETNMRHLPMTVSVVNRNKIEGRYEASLLPVLGEQIPGLFITSRGIMGYGVSTGGSGGMSLRGIGGSPTTGLLVLIDGHPQYMGLMGHPIADAYQSMLAEKVEVVRGPASVLYGSNSMGGVINIITRRQQEDGVKTNARIAYGAYNTLTTEAASQIKRGRLSSIVTASYNRTDGHRADMEFEQYGAYAKSSYELSSVWNMSGDVNLTHFNASNPGASDAPVFDNDSRITRGMASLSLDNNYEKTSGALKLFYNWGRHKINDGYKSNESPLDYRFNSKDRMLGVLYYQSLSLFTGNRLTAGIDYTRFGGNAWNAFVSDGHEEVIADESENEIAGYVDFRQMFGSYLAFDAGLRFNHHSIVGNEWIPQAGISLQLPSNAVLKAAASKGFRNPTIRELYMFRPANPDLRSEGLWNYELSYSQHLLNNRFIYGLNIFYINGDNMIQVMPVDGRPLNVNTGKVENWGLEFNTAYHINPTWNITANYSWLHMEHLLIAAPEHKLYLGLDFTKGRWTASSGLQYINGLYTSVAPNPLVSESFLLWNIRGSYRLCSAVNFFAKGENLLSQDYGINAGYPMPGATIFGGINITF